MGDIEDRPIDEPEVEISAINNEAEVAAEEAADEGDD